MGFLRQERMGCHFLLQGIFLIQALNLYLLHCRQNLYHLATWEAHICMYIYICVYTHTHTHNIFNLSKNASVWIYMCTHTYFCVCAYIYIYIHTHIYIWSLQFSSTNQLCPNLCNPMDCSTPGLPVHHKLLDFIQTHVLVSCIMYLCQSHVHWCHPTSHPLSFPFFSRLQSFPASSSFPTS